MKRKHGAGGRDITKDATPIETLDALPRPIANVMLVLALREKKACLRNYLRY